MFDRDWVENAEAVANNNPRYHALVLTLADSIYRGDFTAAELLAAIPLADRIAMSRKVRDRMNEPKRIILPPGMTWPL